MNTHPIAVRVISWIAIALSMGSCSANSHLAANAPEPGGLIQPSNASENLVPATVASESTQLFPSAAASPTADPTAAEVKASTTQTPVPSVHPLDSIHISGNGRLSDARRGPGDYGGNMDVATSLDIAAGSTADRQSPKKPSGKFRTQIGPCKAFPCLILSQDTRNLKNKFNNPIYKLTAYRNDTSTYEFQLDAVTGRGFTQTRNRYQSNTEAPLPDGSYVVVPRIVNGTLREVGGTMVPIFPKPGFNRRMTRTALGIHWDPSFGKDPKEDGTSGCIGLTKKEDYQRVKDFILKYHPRSLEVNIANQIATNSTNNH